MVESDTPCFESLTDDMAIFHYLCKEFDARAYIDMGEEEQRLYNQLANALSIMEKIALEKNMSEENCKSNQLSMLIAVGCYKENSFYEELYKNGMDLLKLFELKNRCGE